MKSLSLFVMKSLSLFVRFLPPEAREKWREKARRIIGGQELTSGQSAQTGQDQEPLFQSVSVGLDAGGRIVCVCLEPAAASQASISEVHVRGFITDLI